MKITKKILIFALLLNVCNGNKLQLNDCKENMYLAKTYNQNKQSQNAKQIYEQECNNNCMEACWNIGFMYEFGLGKTTINEKLAVKYYEIACDNNFYEACYNLALMYDSLKVNTKNENLAYQLYEKACYGKYSSACTMLGMKYQENKNDKVKAKVFYKKGCDLNDEDSCKLYDKLN